uniref:Ladybird homeobox 1 n=1 Tax=Accipiter nisus TaxID=211598 RepID=A0A8B9N133_9AVES
MTSKEEPKPSSGEERRRSPLDHLPPPANSNKPLTPFSIEDILNKPSVRRSYTLCGTAHLLSAAEKHPPAGLPLSGRALLSQTSPLCALEELASKTFKGLEVSVLQAAEDLRAGEAVPLPKIPVTGGPGPDRPAAGAHQCPGHHLVPEPPRQAQARPGGDEGRRGIGQKAGPQPRRGHRGLGRAGAQRRGKGQGAARFAAAAPLRRPGARRPAAAPPRLAPHGAAPQPPGQRGGGGGGGGGRGDRRG